MPGRHCGPRRHCGLLVLAFFPTISLICYLSPISTNNTKFSPKSHIKQSPPSWSLNPLSALSIMCTHTRTCTHRHKHTHTQACAQKCIHGTHIHTYTYACTHHHTCTHTHPSSLSFKNIPPITPLGCFGNESGLHVSTGCSLTPPGTFSKSPSLDGRGSAVGVR